MRGNIISDSLRYTFKEHFTNKRLIFQLSKENMRQQTLRTSLGIGWVLIRDLVYFTVFIMFRYLMSGSGEVEGMNFILFLMLGIIPWNIMSECINGSVMIIERSKGYLANLKMPIVILPTVEIIAVFMKRLFTFLIMIAVVAYFGDFGNIVWWMMIYYLLCMLVIMVAWNLIFSSLVAISNDFDQLYKAAASVLFYAMPVIWSFDALGSNDLVISVFKLNPFVYIIEGFRDAGAIGSIPDLQYTVYFWVVCMFLITIGSILQYKLRRHYVDLI